MAIKTSARFQHVQSPAIRDVVNQAQRLERVGRRIAHLEIGRPDFDTPEVIKRAAIHALERGEVHYGPSAGIEPLRQALAIELNRKHDSTISPDRIVITNGAVEALYLTLSAVIDPGDEVLILEPAWTAYENIVLLLGGVPRLVPCRPENHYLPDIEECRAAITDRTVAMMVNSPNNPTGAVISDSLIAGLAQLAHEYDLLVVSDEVYEDISYTDTPVRSIASLNGMLERTALVSAFSKTYSMTGWRIGYVALPESLRQVALLSHIHLVTSVNTFIQYGALAAFTDEAAAEARAMVSTYAERRQMTLDSLALVPGVSCHAPLGGFFVFPKFEHFPDDKELARLLLEQANVATVPGSAFGPTGRGHLRISFSQSNEDLALGLAAIEKWIAARSRY